MGQFLETLARDNGRPIACQEPKAFFLEQRLCIKISSDNPHAVQSFDEEEREIDLSRQETIIIGKGIFVMIVMPL